MKKVVLVTDGACLGNPGPGGWGYILRYEKTEKEASGREANTTNNRMELMAVIAGLEALKEPCEVTIISDSRYVIDAFEKGWLSSWQRNGWKTADRKEVKNQDLWQRLLSLTAPHRVNWTWVKGHSGDPDNERVDVLARQAAEGVSH